MLRRLSLPLDQFIGTSAVRAYATSPSKGGKAPVKNTGSRLKAAQVGGRGGNRDTGAGDSRVEAIRNVLFDSDPTHEARLESLATVIPSLEAHTTITRAWALHQRHVRLAHEGEMARKHDSMVSAINLLEKVDRTLWDKSVGGKKFQNVDQRENTNARLEGMVPREMRIPVEVPGDNMWDGNWTAPGKVEPVVKK